MSGIGILPADCVVLICRFLSPRTTLFLGTANRQLAVAVDSDAVWQSLLISQFGPRWQREWGDGARYPPLPGPYPRQPPLPQRKATFLRMCCYSEFELYTGLGTNAGAGIHIDALKGVPPVPGEPRPLMISKVIILGPRDVGKTSLLIRLAGGDPTEFTYQRPDFTITTLQRKGIPPAPAVKLQTWDPVKPYASFRMVRWSSFRKSFGIVLCYSIVDQQSFDNLVNWEREIKQYGEAYVQVLLVGLKTDLADKRCVSYDQGWSFAQQRGWRYAEACSLTGHNVLRIFLTLATDIDRFVVPIVAPKPVQTDQGWISWFKSKLGW